MFRSEVRSEKGLRQTRTAKMGCNQLPTPPQLTPRIQPHRVLRHHAFKALVSWLDVKVELGEQKSALPLTLNWPKLVLSLLGSSEAVHANF